MARAAAAAALAALALVLELDAPSRAAGTELSAFRTAATAPRVARVANVEWWGGSVTAGTGEPVTVYVSTSYPQDEAFARSWADFFAGLIHGDELARLAVYVATPAEVGALCGRAEVLGCDGGGRMAVPGEAGSGVAPTVIAAHEYGHHVAAHRDNAPWRAVDWGPKRWASHVGVCARTNAGAFFPGDEDRFYAQNPGEGFAEAYRLLNESRGGATSFSWPLVDQSFYPDAAAFGAIEEDVLRPWSAPTLTTLSGRFRDRGPRVWRRTIASPLDGDLVVALTVPPAATYELDLLAADGAVLGRGLWSGARRKSVRLTICGQRSITLRVTRRGAAGPFRAEASRP